MGRVYRAHHTGLDKDVAIKVLRESAVPDPTRSKRFQREAKAASRLSHPNSVAVLDFGEDGDDRLLYIAMEFLEGEDLQVVIDRGTLLGVDRICKIMIQALAALAAAHDAGIIHRDMKPSNIVLVEQMNDEGQLTEVVKVCDFGVAKFSSGDRDTLDGGRAQRVIGTPLYMSPEQAVGDELDPRTDVYSCGVIMYEMLTGQPPFTAETPMGVLMKHVSEPTRRPSSLVPHVPKALEALILWSLEKKRDKRPSSARELRNALRAFLTGKSGTVPALARYGVEPTPEEEPWEGSTPFLQLEEAPRPSSNDRGILPAPPLPPLLTGPEITGPEKKETPHQHLELVADLDLIADLDLALETGGGRRPEPPARASAEAKRDGGGHPKGTRVPAGLRSSTTDGLILNDFAEDKVEIFDEQSYFGVNDPKPEVRRPEPDEVSLEAPPPRSLIRAGDTDPKVSVEDKGHMAAYLWERFGIPPQRRVPDDGFWLRDNHDREIGPLTWSETTHALRMEASDGGADDVSVSSDQTNWVAAARFVQLTGVEAILETSRALPKESPLSGQLSESSVAAVFAEASAHTVTGRLMFRVHKDRRNARFDIHLDSGKPTFVFTNEPQLQAPNLLVVKGILSEDKLPPYIRKAASTAVPLEELVAEDVLFDPAQYRAAVMKERLRSLLRWPDGQFALEEGGRPASRHAFAESLLALLPDLVYRSLPTELLETELKSLLSVPLVRAEEASERLEQMGLTRSQRGVAERLLGAPRLELVMPPEGRIRKAYTTMAYVLRETGLLLPETA